jgi:hypothetical protein
LSHFVGGMMNKKRMIVLTGALVLATAMQAEAATTYGPPTPPAFPIHPYQATLFLSPNSSAVTGPGTGVQIGVTSITLANNGSTAVQVDMFQATTTGATCTGTVTAIGGSPDTFVMVAPYQTLHLDFQTPLLISHLNGQSCLAFDAVSGLASGNSISVLVNGFQN